MMRFYHSNVYMYIFLITTFRACFTDAYHSYYIVDQAMVVLIQVCPFRVVVSSLLK